MSAPAPNYDPNHPLTKALRDLVSEHKLAGGVLLTFTTDADGGVNLGINSSGSGPETGEIMNRVANELFAHFAAGHYDSAVQGPN